MTDALRAAMVRFSTLDQSLWPRAFASLRALGFNAIDLPVVWRDHENADGTIDVTSGRRSLGAALEAVAKLGLRAIVRVGPMNTPDARGLGLPERVLLDRRFHARTRRQNPVVVPDLPRFVPLPSLASVDFLREATTWVQTVCESLAPHLASGLVARVVLGYGPHPIARDEPWFADHHPDEGSPEQHYKALIETACRAGVNARLLAVAFPGGALTSPVACTLARDHRLAFAAPPPSAGTASIWRMVSHGASMPKGSHWDFQAGCAPSGLPMRNAHAVGAARAAIAAGARDYTVWMGCVGDRWAGALLDERAVPRASANAWAGLNDEAVALPTGRARAAAIVVAAETLHAAQTEAVTGPMSLGLLTWLGATPGALSDATAATGQAAARRAAVERALTDAGLPWRWTLEAGAGDEIVATDEPDVSATVSAALGACRVASDPPGRVLVRAVTAEAGDALVVVSAWDEPVTLHPADGWSGEGSVVGPGEMWVLRRTGGAG